MNQSEIPGMPDWLRGSKMGELIFENDWSESGLGPIHAWPLNLKFVVSTMLSLPSAAILLWGPKLIQIYNDSHRDVMGAKHPGGLGQPVRECWPEVWDFVQPICDGVMQRRESFIFDDKPLTINRHGVLEESFFKLTFSPVPASISDDKEIQTNMPGGVLVTVHETTEVIRARAREAEHIHLTEAVQAKRIQLLEEVFRNAPSFMHVLRGPEFISTNLVKTTVFRR